MKYVLIPSNFYLETIRKIRSLSYKDFQEFSENNSLYRDMTPRIVIIINIYITLFYEITAVSYVPGSSIRVPYIK